MANIGDTITNKIKAVADKIEPWQWVVGIIVVGVGLVTYIKNKATPKTVLEENPVLSAGSSGGGSVTSAAEQVEELKDQISGVISQNNDQISTAFDDQAAALTATNEKLSSLSDAYTSLYQQFNNMSNTQDSANQIISKTTETLTTLTDKINSGTTGTISTIDDDLQEKIDASNQVSLLGKRWADLNKKFKSDGTVSASEKSQLEAIHNTADAIGYAAGLQDKPTTKDGSERKLYAALK
jgi:DNA repair exonuclease SbcCD ATPase subunit